MVLRVVLLRVAELLAEGLQARGRRPKSADAEQRRFARASSALKVAVSELPADQRRDWDSHVERVNDDIRDRFAAERLGLEMRARAEAARRARRPSGGAHLATRDMVLLVTRVIAGRPDLASLPAEKIARHLLDDPRFKDKSVRTVRRYIAAVRRRG